jgi:hypothetical protein
VRVSTGAPWQYRVRYIPGSNKQFLVQLLPSPGDAYPYMPSPDEFGNLPPDPDYRFKLELRDGVTFDGFLGSPSASIPDVGEFRWKEDFDHMLLTPEEIRADYEPIEDEMVPPLSEDPEPFTLRTYLQGLQTDTNDTSLLGLSEEVDPRTKNPSSQDVDDESSGLTNGEALSPNFGRDRAYDRLISESCERSGNVEAILLDDADAEGPSFGVLAAESGMLFDDDGAAQAPGSFDFSKYSIAPSLKNILILSVADETVFQQALEQSRKGKADLLIDPSSFAYKHPADDYDQPVGLLPAVDEERDYDLIPGEVFQSPENIALCWDLQFETKSVDDDDLTVYTKGFEYFLVTRTILTKAKAPPRVERIYATWLDPSQAGRFAERLSLVRPQFQFVDRDVQSPDLASANESNEETIEEGDLVQYRVEAIGARPEPLATTEFQLVRRTVRLVQSPAAANALHMPEVTLEDGVWRDDPRIDLTIVMPDEKEYRSDDRPRFVDEIRVGYRLVPAGTIGSYGLDAPPLQGSGEVSGLSDEAGAGLEAPQVNFSASPQAKPLPWTEVEILEPRPEDWEVYKQPVPEGNESSLDPDPPKFLCVLRQSAIRLSMILKKIEEFEGAEATIDKAIELWIGREIPARDKAPVRRSQLVQCRHAVFAPVQDEVNVLLLESASDPQFLIRGNPVHGIEKLPDFHPNETERYLSSQQILSSVTGSPPVIVGEIENDVRIAVEWRVPNNLVDLQFNPTIAFQAYRIERTDPVAFRAKPEGVRLKLDRSASLLSEQVYRATPDRIDLQPLVRKEGTKTRFFADWQPTGDRHEIWTATENEEPFPYGTIAYDSGRLLHTDLLETAKQLAVMLFEILGEEVTPVWTFRDSMEDRADLRANEDRSDTTVPTDARNARFKAAWEKFRLDYAEAVDPYGWQIAESLGLSAELHLANSQGESVRLTNDLFAKIADRWDPSSNFPVCWLTFLADNNETYLDVMRLIHVGTIPAWNAADLTTFDPKAALSLKMIGIDPVYRQIDTWPGGRHLQDFTSGPELIDVLKDAEDAYVKRLAKGLNLVEGAPLINEAGGRRFTFRQSRVVPNRPSASLGNDMGRITDNPPETPPARLPISVEGTVRFDIPVPDRLAHEYLLAIKVDRRYDALWKRLVEAAITDAPSIQEELVPYDRLHPVSIDRTHDPADDTLLRMDQLLANTPIDQSVYLLMATYIRHKDDPAEPWTAPGEPMQVIDIKRIDSDNEFARPKSAAVILHAPIHWDGGSVENQDFHLSGFGRLDDEDFGPIEPSPLKDPESESDALLVGWSRVARLEVLDRLSSSQNPSNLRQLKRQDTAKSAFEYDVVFYGPGGELVPTRENTQTNRFAIGDKEDDPLPSRRPPEP